MKPGRYYGEHGFTLVELLILLVAIIVVIVVIWRFSDLSPPRYVECTSNNGLNIRAGSSTNYKKIGVLLYKQQARVLEVTKTGWMKVEPKPKGATGWVFAKYCRSVKGALGPDDPHTLASVEYSSEKNGFFVRIWDKVSIFLITCFILLSVSFFLIILGSQLSKWTKGGSHTPISTYNSYSGSPSNFLSSSETINRRGEQEEMFKGLSIPPPPLRHPFSPPLPPPPPLLRSRGVADMGETLGDPSNYKKCSFCLGSFDEVNVIFSGRDNKGRPICKVCRESGEYDV